MRVGGIARHHRRSRALSAALVLAAALAGLTSRQAAGTTRAFDNGTGKAVATTAKLAPGVGSLEIGVTSGVAIAELRNRFAQAQAQTVDLGILDTALTIEQCDGGDPMVRREQLPQPTRVDNRRGDATAARDQVPLGGGPGRVGRMVATATSVPSSEAVATAGQMTVGALLEVDGGQRASTGVVDGAAREARAVVELDLDIANIVQLAGLRWEALHRTGADATAHGTFTIGSAEAGDVRIPTEERAAAEQAVNAALVPVGITVTLPEVRRSEEPSDIVQVTPLRVVLQDSPAGRTVLGPVLGATREARGTLFDELVALHCQLAAPLLVGDIALKGVSMLAR